MKQPPSEKDTQRFKKAMKYLEGGKPSEALKLFEKVRKSWCDDPDIGYLEGLAYGKLGNFNGIIQVSRRALKLDENHFGVLCNLANAQMGLGDSEAALDNYAKALKSKPDAPEVMDNYGRALSILGRRDEAIEQFKKSLSFNIYHAPAYASLGKAYAEAGQPTSALEQFKKSLKIDPSLSEAHIGMGVLNCGLGGLEDADYHFNEALRKDKQNFVALIGLANVKRYTGEYEKGLKILQKAEKINVADPVIAGIKANLLEQKGDKDLAFKVINELIDSGNMNSQSVAVFSRLCRKYDRCDEALEFIDQFINKKTSDTTEKQALMYAAGDLLDKMSRYDEAIEYYHKANASMDISCNRADYIRQHNEIIDCFTKQRLAGMPRANSKSSRPIFVIGMPRSGTTLTEQILASHGDVYGAGELHYIKQINNSTIDLKSAAQNDLISRLSRLDQEKLNVMANEYLEKINKLDSKSRYVIDKMPHNFLEIGLISLLFPEARIIHCKRNALDNCLSIYFQSFIWSHDYALDLSDIGFFYNEYERIMKHWEEVIGLPMLTVQYEDVLQDQEGMSRKLLEFCDLDWDDSVMKFYDSKRDVGTASYDQVRRPIYQSSKERWKNYEKHIGPLMESLESVG